MAIGQSKTALLHRHAFAGKDALLDGRYRMLRLLGEGGMGAVYVAEHVILRRQVAIKFLLADYAANKEMIARFHREARAAAAIQHKNIIDIFDVGVSTQGSPFLVMEYLEGESLAALLKRAGPLNLGETCAILEQALLGLQAAHDKGILHRDLKPENLFLAYVPNQPPTVKLIDFGISKFMEGGPDQSRTQTGFVLGTPAYMSPEQARGLSTVDRRSDLFSMGTILYEMLTGAWPFVGNTFADLVAKLLFEPPKPPHLVRADFPAQAQPLLDKALAKHPDQRFQSADEMLAALRGLDGFAQRMERLASLASTIRKRGFAAGDLGEKVLGADSAAQSEAAIEDAPPTIWNRRRITLGIVAAAVLAVLVVAVLWGVGRGPKTAAPSAQQARPPLEAPVLQPSNPAPVPPPVPAKEAPVLAPEPARDKIEPSPAREASEEKPEQKPTPSKGRQRPARPAKPALTTSPAAKAPPEKSEGKSLRSGSRGTKMSESFE
jgi:eukaryotic-like serine/threonine-protein kinase